MGDNPMSKTRNDEPDRAARAKTTDDLVTKLLARDRCREATLRPHCGTRLLNTNVELVCRYCINVRVPDGLIDPGTRARVEALNFKPEGPLQHYCDLCHGRFKTWWIPDAEWNRLPEQYRKMQLCIDDYLRLSNRQENEVHPSFAHWEHVLAEYERTKDIPADKTKIVFPINIGGVDHAEHMWCKVLEHRGDLAFAVILQNDSFFNHRIVVGSRWLAKWDGLYNGLTCRPSLIPICEMGSPSRRRRKGRVKVC
jgi:hypothetical protein